MEILESDGGTRVTGINAAALALADAGIPMKGMVSATASGIVDDTVVLDVNGLEDKKGNADIPIATINGGDEITLLQMDGDISKETLDEALSLAKQGCTDLYEEQRQALLEKYESIRGDYK